MRIRAGFVSNSSTSSFVIFFPSADNVRACDALKQGIDAAADEGLLDDLVASCFEAQREYDIDSDYDAGDSDSGGEDELQRAQEELELQQIDDEEERERERARLKMLKRVKRLLYGTGRGVHDLDDFIERKRQVSRNARGRSRKDTLNEMLRFANKVRRQAPHFRWARSFTATNQGAGVVEDGLYNLRAREFVGRSMAMWGTWGSM